VVSAQQRSAVAVHTVHALQGSEERAVDGISLQHRHLRRGQLVLVQESVEDGGLAV
jgi:hypothetical protein